MADETASPLDKTRGDLGGDLRAVSVISQVSLVEDEPCALLLEPETSKRSHRPGKSTTLEERDQF